MKIQNLLSVYNYNNFNNKLKLSETKNKNSSINNTLNSYQLNFKRAKKPVYVIDEKGDYKKFNSGAEAAEYINIHSSYLCSLLSSGRKTAKNYAFIKASEVEKYDENSNLVVDEKQIKKLANLIKNPDPKARTPRVESVKKNKITEKTILQPIYAIRADGRYQKFASTKEIEKVLGFKPESVNLVLHKQMKSLFDYTFVRAHEVEKQNEEGKSIADKDKIDNYAQSIFDKRVYIIDKNGNYKKFDSQSKAAKFIGCSKELVSNALSDKRKAKGYLVVRASDVEIKFANSAKVVDRTKITKILGDDILKELSKNYYVIYKNGQYERYTSQDKIARALNCTQSRIFLLLGNGGIDEQKGFAIVRASNIEQINKNNEIEINKEAIEDIVKILQKINN